LAGLELASEAPQAHPVSLSLATCLQPSAEPTRRQVIADADAAALLIAEHSFDRLQTLLTSGVPFSPVAREYVADLLLNIEAGLEVRRVAVGLPSKHAGFKFGRAA